MSAVFRVRVASQFQTQFAGLLPLVQAHSLVSVSPSDVARLCLERGITVLCAELSLVDSSVKTTKKQDRVPILPRPAAHAHTVLVAAPDPGSLEPGTVAVPATALASEDAVPLVGTATGPKRESLEVVHGTRIREIATGYPRLGTTGKGKLSWDRFAAILAEEHGITNPATGKAFSNHAVEKVVKGQS